jgi:hypothetical protein
MGNIGDPITQPIPPVGTTGTAYASQIDAFLGEVQTRLQTQVPLSSLASGLFNLANNPLTNAQYVSLYPGTVTPTLPSGSIQNYGGDLYWVTGTGAVKITSGNTINIAGVNGITGDYGGANPAQFRFVDTDQEFYAFDDFSLGQYGRLWAKNFDLSIGNTGVSRVRFDATGVASSYTLTLPSAPAAQSLIQMGTSGTLTATNTLASNANLTLSGTGYVKRGNSIVYYIPVIGSLINTTGVAITTTNGLPGAGFIASTTAYIPLLLNNFEERIQSVVVRSTGPGTPTGTVTATLCWADGISGFGNNVTGATGITWTAAASTVTLTPTTPATINHAVWVKIVTAAASTVTVLEIEVHLDIP